MPGVSENQTLDYDESGGKGAEEGPGAMQSLYMCQLWQVARGVGRPPSPLGVCVTNASCNFSACDQGS